MKEITGSAAKYSINASITRRCTSRIDYGEASMKGREYRSRRRKKDRHLFYGIRDSCSVPCTECLLQDTRELRRQYRRLVDNSTNSLVRRLQNEIFLRPAANEPADRKSIPRITTDEKYASSSTGFPYKIACPEGRSTSIGRVL